MRTDTPDDWDEYADRFDEAPDHGLTDPAVRTAWADLLLPVLPDPPADLADLGCGTGSVSVLLASAGHRVVGVDLSPAMLARARTKASAAGVDVDLRLGDVRNPPLAPRAFDVVLARHVLWVFAADPDPVVATWLALLRPGGLLVLVEGRWSTGAGLTADECRSLVERHARDVEVHDLSDRDALWGWAVHDERYLVLARP